MLCLDLKKSGVRCYLHAYIPCIHKGIRWVDYLIYPTADNDGLSGGGGNGGGIGSLDWGLAISRCPRERERIL